jgi:arylsulfatase A-like enzyme/Flp pilus assembly protein TadD
LSFVAIVLSLIGCSRVDTPSARPVAKSILLITIDTLRADRLGVYGATNVDTPNIDRLALEGAWARNSTVHVALTRPSHISMFTGRYPAAHGIRDNVAPALAPDVPLLAEMFQREGFATAAFVSSVVLTRQSGLARGFDHYSDRFEIGEDDARFLNTIQKSGDIVTTEASAWLREHPHFFAWVHLYDPHDPYEPPGKYAVQYAERPYDGEVAWSDELVGRLLTVLRDTQRLDNTLVVVTSDHGEGLGEHGEDVHGYFVYESTLRVPLVFRGPGITPGTRIDALTRSVDLFPTLLELAAIETREPAGPGRSLAPALRGERIGDEPSFAESLLPLVHFGWSDLRTVRDGRWKYILAPRPELYDLERDPAENINLAEREPSRARAMRAGLEEWLRLEQRSARSGSGREAVPQDLLEKLGALGYLTGGPAAAKASGADPKDKLEEYKTLNTQMRLGLIALREGRPADTLDHLGGLARRGVDSFEMHYYRGRALTLLKRWRDAASAYEKAIDKLPAYSAAWRALAESRVAVRDLRGAAAAYEQLVSLVPRDALARVQLGEVYRDMGRREEAVRLMQAAVEIDPGPASYWNSLGMVLGGARRMAEAERAFGEAAARDADNAQYVYNRGLALQRLGRRDDAVAQFERAAGMGFPPARTRLAELR